MTSQIKHVILICSIILICMESFGQSYPVAPLSLTLIKRDHLSYGVSCYGGNNGSVDAIIEGGSRPYQFVWSDNTGTYTNYSKNISGLSEGTYTLTVTDANQTTIQASINIRQPGPLSVVLIPSVFEGGFNLPCQGCQEGHIETEMSGGVPPYTYQWSNNATSLEIGGLVAGNYNVIVTDANGCTTSGSKSLIQPTPLHFISVTSPVTNGNNIVCNGGRTGIIDISLTGGAANYRYELNGEKFENLSGTHQFTGLSAGEYNINVTDLNDITIQTTIILTEPSPIEITYTKLVYPNGLNVSCYNCANGNITANVSGGTAPYS